MDFAARMIRSLWIISACILRGVGVASSDNNFCGSNITNLKIPCLQQQQTLGVPLNKARASRTANILMPTDLANSLPPKNFSLKSVDHSVSIGGKITTDYFSDDEAKRWNVSLSFSTLPNELKHITLVQLTYTVVNFTGVDEFWSTIHIHVNDNIYEWHLLLFHKQDTMSSESTSTTSAKPPESVISSTTPVISSESEGEASKPYPILLILSIIFIVVLILIIIALVIWICYPRQVKRWRSQNCLLRRIESAIHGTPKIDPSSPRNTASSSPRLVKYTNISQSDTSSPGEANTHEMEVRVPMADINHDDGNLHEQDESHQLPATEDSPCIGQATCNGETCVVDVHQTERVDSTEQQQPTAEINLHAPTEARTGETCVVDIHQTERVDSTEQRQSKAEINLHAPTEACKGTLSALGEEKTEPGEEDIVDQHTVGLGIPETQEIQAQEKLIQREDTDLESDSDD